MSALLQLEWQLELEGVTQSFGEGFLFTNRALNRHALAAANRAELVVFLAGDVQTVKADVAENFLAFRAFPDGMFVRMIFAGQSPVGQLN